MRKLSCIALGLLTFCCSSVLAQDIILLDANGEKAGVAKIGKDKKIGEPVKGTAKKANDEKLKGKRRATMVNGVITIVNEDGSKEEINLSDARSVVISRSSKAIIGDDGKPQMKTTGKATLVGPDGVRREIMLDENGGGEAKMNPDLPKTWVVGVSVSPVSNLLRSHLKLDENSGLVVNRVFPGGAAERAGLKKDDILLFADQKMIGNQKQLADVVNAAGADESSVTFTILRSGDEESISIEPTERENVGGLRGMNFEAFGGLGGLDGLDLEFKQFGPGIIIGDDGDMEMQFDFNDRINERFQKIQREMREMRRALRDGNK